LKDEEVGSVKQLNSYLDFSSFILFFLLLRLNIKSASNLQLFTGSSYRWNHINHAGKIGGSRRGTQELFRFGCKATTPLVFF